MEKDHETTKHFGYLDAFWWQQTPLGHREVLEILRHKCRKMSLRTKLVLLLTLALFLFGLASVFISYRLYIYAAMDQHERLSAGMAHLFLNIVDGDKVGEYIERGENADGYKEAYARLLEIKESTQDIKYIYIYKVTEDGCTVVFDVDVPGDPGDPPGMKIPLDPAMEIYRDKLLAGEAVPPIIDGLLFTLYTPIYDSQGVCQAYAAADISTYDMEQQAHKYLMRITFIFLALFVTLWLIALQFAKYNLIMPINSLAHFVDKFAYNSEEAMERSLKKIRRLGIYTGDEVENLYLAYLKTAEDSVRHIKDIREKNETISQMQKTLIMTMADLVERRDENTGQHIKKTAAYVRIIMEEMKRQGIYKRELTDKFIDDVVMAAPLHDVGKITIPDSILNKPSKLTDEEFEIMKSHTVAGGRIIVRIIDSVPDTDYLYEAADLATYHHERFDGKGYPVGLDGEDIPLAARVMAVADVFDALVSKRVYKDGISNEKAMQIIWSESGTHFDPKVIKAFLAAKNEIFSVAVEFNEMEEEGSLE